VKAVIVVEDEMIEKIQKLHKYLIEKQEFLPNEFVKDDNDNSTIIITDDIQDERLLDDLMDEPLVSLEQSLQEVMHIIPALKNYINICMVNSQNPADGLTQNESASIRIYSMEFESNESCLYSLLKRDLQSGTHDAVKKWFPYLRLFLHALNKLPSYQGTIFRGIPGDMSNEFPIGQLLSLTNFTSTTPNMAIIESYLRHARQGARTILLIECMSGKCISKHSEFPIEDEIVLPPGFCCEVTNRLVLGNGVYLISLKEINAPKETYKKYSTKQKTFKKVFSYISVHFHKHK